LGKCLSASISDLLDTEVGFTTTGLHEISYGKYLKSVDDPESCWVLGSSFGAVWVELSPRIARRIVGLLLGGSGSPPPPSGRNLTVIERSVLQRVVDRIADTVGRFLNAELTQGGSQDSQSDHQEQVIVGGFRFAVGDAAGTMRLCIPQRLLVLAAGGDETEAKHSEEPRATNRPVELSVVAGETTLPAADLADLAPGDVLVTDVDADDEIIVRLNGKSAFAGRLGSRNGKRAITIIRPLDEEEHH
jgi:flagellar motor switch protein FliM